MNIREREPLAQYTTFGVGGAAEYFTEAHNSQEIEKAVHWAKERSVPFWILAGGSNVVCAEFVPGLCVRVTMGTVSVEGSVVRADASAPLALLVESAIKAGLSGLEQLSGIPGSVGGALVGNAGAYGRSISDSLVFVRALRGGVVETIQKSEGGFTYRTSQFKRPENQATILLDAEFLLTPGNTEALKEESARIISIRAKKYPPSLKCPGSFFKNVLVETVSKETLALIDPSKIIEGKIPTGYLLEAVGACGMKAGALEIAPYHGNLMLNTGSATQGEVQAFARRLAGMVEQRFGIELEEEVRYVV